MAALTVEAPMELITTDYQQYFKQIYDEITHQKREVIDKYCTQLDLNSIASITMLGEKAVSRLNRLTDQTLALLTKPNRTCVDSFVITLEGILESFEAAKVTKTKGYLNLLPIKRKTIKNDGSCGIKNPLKLAQSIEQAYIEIKRYQDTVLSDYHSILELEDVFKSHYKEIMYTITACKHVLEELKTKKTGQNDAVEDSIFQGIHSIDCKAKEERLLNKIHSLELAAFNATIVLPQLQIMQENNERLYKQIKNSFLLTLPQLKNQMIAATTREKHELTNRSQTLLQQSIHEAIKKNGKAMQANNENATIDPAISMCVQHITVGLEQMKILTSREQLDRTNAGEKIKLDCCTL